ncbi:MAG: hypothetical protein NTZ73_02475 [Candidatus Diapherotrites archaeon]|nr:hypothetical protein [Candidatus Diapherotrites archaeon]
MKNYFAPSILLITILFLTQLSGCVQENGTTSPNNIANIASGGLTTDEQILAQQERINTLENAVKQLCRQSYGQKIADCIHECPYADGNCGKACCTDTITEKYCTTGQPGEIYAVNTWDYCSDLATGKLILENIKVN